MRQVIWLLSATSNNCSFTILSTQLLHVHPSSVLFTRTPSTNWVIYHEVIETTKSFIRDLTVIEQDWLVESAQVDRCLIALKQIVLN